MPREPTSCTVSPSLRASLMFADAVSVLVTLTRPLLQHLMPERRSSPAIPFPLPDRHSPETLPARRGRSSRPALRPEGCDFRWRAEQTLLPESLLPECGL